MGGVNVVKDVEGSLHVTAGRFVVVGRKEGVSRSEVRASALREPADTADETLVGMLALQEGGIVVRLSAFRNGVDGNARPVRSSQRRRRLVMLVELFSQVCGEASLAKVDGDRIRSDLPLEVDAEEPLDGVHKVNLEVLGEKTLEFLLYGVIRREVYEVIDVEPHGEGSGGWRGRGGGGGRGRGGFRGGRRVRRIIWIGDETSEEAGIVGV
mmetsp:Transcript_56903/g.120811  ORF Transcript_56903/g.120811 Transcript_56903/m.120811 type:complete len:211 (-) Transcript_56903:44-676(-)